MDPFRRSSPLRNNNRISDSPALRLVDSPHKGRAHRIKLHITKLKLFIEILRQSHMLRDTNWEDWTYIIIQSGERLEANRAVYFHQNCWREVNLLAIICCS